MSLLWVHASLSVTSILAAFAAEKVGCGEQNRSARHAHERGRMQAFFRSRRQPKFRTPLDSE
ncbi:MAG: hypothetical protein DME55_04665 [Verrucomicrobia bacterium]|nr:MAG: hypothetical protein DME55_04665 [Verrucomicrobiota bacterium]